MLANRHALVATCLERPNLHTPAFLSFRFLKACKNGEPTSGLKITLPISLFRAKHLNFRLTYTLQVCSATCLEIRACASSEAPCCLRVQAYTNQASDHSPCMGIFGMHIFRTGDIVCNCPGDQLLLNLI
jgi:hypothetical protein